jgi:hypothetical protein
MLNGLFHLVAGFGEGVRCIKSSAFDVEALVAIGLIGIGITTLIQLAVQIKNSPSK